MSTELDRYITEEVRNVAVVAWCHVKSDESVVNAILRAALPHIEPLIRADVLREVECPACGAVTRERMADAP